MSPKRKRKNSNEIIQQNPFLPPRIVTPMKWSYSTLKLFRKCKRKHYWTKIFRLIPRREAAPLVISNVVHEGLAKWYSSTRASMKRIARTVVKTTKKRIEAQHQFYNQDDYDEMMILLSTVEGMLIGYSRVYSDDKKIWEFNKNDVEAWFNVDRGDYEWRGKIDLLLCKGKTQLVMDHKVISNINSSFIDKLPLDGQLRGYIVGARDDLNRLPKRVIYNLIKKCKLRKKSGETTKDFTKRIREDYENRPDFYYSRESLTFDKGDIEAFLRDLDITHEEYSWYINQKVRDPLKPESWPCTDTTCDEYFRNCPFQPLCLEGLNKGTARLYTQYNPELKKKKSKNV